MLSVRDRLLEHPSPLKPAQQRPVLPIMSVGLEPERVRWRDQDGERQAGPLPRRAAGDMLVRGQQGRQHAAPSRRGGRAVSEPTRIEADYLLETAFDPRKAAEVDGRRAVERHLRAGPGRDAGAQGARRRAGRGVWSCLGEAVKPLRCPAPARRKRRPTRRSPGARRPCPGRSTISAPRCPNLLATVAGNLFELKQVSGLRLLDIRLPARLRRGLSRPAFRHRGHAPARRRRRAAADRHHHQAQRRLRRRRRPPTLVDDAVRGRHRLHQGRRAAGRRPALPLRRARCAR